MKAYKCDRCGKFYSYDEFVKHSASSKDSNPFKKGQRPILTVRNQDSYEIKYCPEGAIRLDMCPDCTHSFMRWFTEPGTDVLIASRLSE